MASPQRGKSASAEEVRAKILEAIDEGFKDILGDSCSRAIYYYFQTRTGLQIGGVVERPEALVSFLREMFKAGARVLERRITEKLCVKFDVNPREVGGTDLASLIRKILSKK